MGLSNLLKGLKEKAENFLKEETDPAKIRAAKKEANEKKMKRTAAGIKLAQKGLEVANNVSAKIEQVSDAAAETTAKLAEKAAPLAEKVDAVAGKTIDGAITAASKAGETAVTAFNVVKDKVVEGTLTAGAKIEEIKEESAKKPSTGSSILDLIAPAVPNTEATKPKNPETPKAPTP